MVLALRVDVLATGFFVLAEAAALRDVVDFLELAVLLVVFATADFVLAVEVRVFVAVVLFFRVAVVFAFGVVEADVWVSAFWVSRLSLAMFHLLPV